MMILWILAVAGSVLVLTQSSITEPIRTWLANSSRQAIAVRDLRKAYNSERKRNTSMPELRPAMLTRIWSHVSSLLVKLSSCPMCCGFWLGAIWGASLLPLTIPAATGSHWFPMAIRIFANGFSGSIVSAISVAAWLALSEAQAVSYLWRSRNTKPDAPRMRVPLKMCPAFVNHTPTVFFCACGEAVPVGASHVLTDRCGDERTEP